ncbi:MAG TPA: NAD(P)-dependent oxidoreductase [Gemmatimonadales bacterium]
MILLTGGTGFVGRHLIHQFALDSRPVRVLSRTPGHVPVPAGVTWAAGDLRDVASLRVALHGVDTVVHAAAVLPGAALPDRDLEAVNSGGTDALARAARDASVTRFIHISSAGVYGDGVTATPHRESDEPSPGNTYERSKLGAERALAAAFAGSSVAWTILRPQGLYGADRPATAAQFREVATRRIWIHASARVMVHPTYIADLVTAVVLVIDRADLHAEVINIGGSRPLELPELIELIGARMGHTPFQLVPPRAAGRVAAIVARGWTAFGTPPAALTRQAREWINRAVAIDKARRLLGFEPVGLEYGLDQTAMKLLQPT